MAGIIRLNAEGLSSASAQIKQQSSEFESLIDAMSRVIESLPESWEGDAALAYGEQFTNLRPGLNNVKVLMEDIAKQIDDTLKAAQDLDDVIAKQLRKS